MPDWMIAFIGGVVIGTAADQCGTPLWVAIVVSACFGVCVTFARNMLIGGHGRRY